MYDTDKIKHHMELKGLNMRRLGFVANADNRTVKNLVEKGECKRPESVYRVCKVLGIPVSKVGDGPDTVYDFSEIVVGKVLVSGGTGE